MHRNPAQGRTVYSFPTPYLEIEAMPEIRLNTDWYNPLSFDTRATLEGLNIIVERTQGWFDPYSIDNLTIGINGIKMKDFEPED